jgi:glutathionyl-hydroquinone reductase
MGMLVQGRWTDNDAPQTGTDGAFVRPSSRFRNVVTADASSGFPAESGRYHLFLAPSCPWANRTAIVRKLKGLEAAISLSQADLPRTQGWTFSRGLDELQPVAGEFPLHRVYTAAMPDYTGRITVPVLWDRRRRTIVNNESSEIIRMLNGAFDAITGDATLDLYPQALRAEIDAINTVIYETVNNGVYRCGFAKSQAAYEIACRKLFATLDDLERRLAGARYLVGNQLTEADVRLFPTLVRFDAVYYGHFKCNLRRLEDYPSLSAYLRDLYQRPAFRDTVDIDEIKRGYYGGQKQLNPTGIVPLGPTLDFERPHGREGLGPD